MAVQVFKRGRAKHLNAACVGFGFAVALGTVAASIFRRSHHVCNRTLFKPTLGHVGYFNQTAPPGGGLALH